MISKENTDGSGLIPGDKRDKKEIRTHSKAVYHIDLNLLNVILTSLHVHHVSYLTLESLRQVSVSEIQKFIIKILIFLKNIQINL